MTTKKPNIILFGIDSLRSDHMSAYGYRYNTTPHIDRFAGEGVLFERNFAQHIPTTSGYAAMLTGMDCFNTQIVALRHKGEMNERIRPLQTILKDEGYATTCIGFESPSARNFDAYLKFDGWGKEKAAKLNEVALPELERLAAQEAPFFLFMRHMDPHSPYEAPKPFDRMFYHGNEFDPANRSMDPVFAFKPFCDYFASWMPQGLTDIKYETAQYDGAAAYMDSCIQVLLNAIDRLGLRDNSIVVFTADHGETLDEHECWFDHHGLYDNVLNVPMIIRYPPKLPAGRRVSAMTTQIDLVPTLLDLAGIAAPDRFDGSSLAPVALGQEPSRTTEFYFTECTWMRKHGWRTPEWKLIRALEPDFHYKPPVELYNLLKDPGENNNLAEQEPELAAFLTARMNAWIARREAQTGMPNPMLNQPGWHGHEGIDYFTSSDEAYNTLHIGDPGAAQRLQAKSKETA